MSFGDVRRVVGDAVSVAFSEELSPMLDLVVGQREEVLEAARDLNVDDLRRLRRVVEIVEEAYLDAVMRRQMGEAPEVAPDVEEVSVEGLRTFLEARVRAYGYAAWRPQDADPHGVLPHGVLPHPDGT